MDRAAFLLGALVEAIWPAPDVPLCGKPLRDALDEMEERDFRVSLLGELDRSVQQFEGEVDMLVLGGRWDRENAWEERA